MRISDWSSDVCSSDLLEIPGGQLALHSSDDVASLAKCPERPLQIVGELPANTADILGEAHAGELLQPPGPERLLKRVAIPRCDQALGIHRPDQKPVDRRHPLLANVVTHPRPDFLVGDRHELERHQPGTDLQNPAVNRLAWVTK